jgi:hypothetical protein
MGEEDTETGGGVFEMRVTTHGVQATPSPELVGEIVSELAVMVSEPGFTAVMTANM